MKKDYWIRPGLYKHFKTGTVYEVVFTGKHSETQEPMVAYRGPQGDVWFRPYEMFISKAKLPDGTMVERFKFMNSDW